MYCVYDVLMYICIIICFNKLENIVNSEYDKKYDTTVHCCELKKKWNINSLSCTYI